uniref:Protein kinase domain-containing protein n=1 Tax=Sparus aurata TaxID=8175 RepID=A0A671Y317_SPAAU
DPHKQQRKHHSEGGENSDSRAFKTYLQRDSSAASVCEYNSLTESFSSYDGDNESVNDESSDIDSYTAQHSGTRSSTGYNADIGSEPATLGERDNFIKTQRDPSPARLWEEDAFTESFSGRNEAIERDAFIKTQRDPSPASLWEEIQKNDVLVSNSTSYLVMDFIAEGCFGKVAKCLDLTTNKSVAVKIHTGNDEFVIQCEIEMLEAIRTLDPEKNNITRFLESFRFNNLSCLAFEMLDRSLFDLMIEGNMMPMRLNEIRPVIHQLLVAFDALKGINMVHTDLKPDNIMLVNQKDQPYRVKLIDFGLARPVRELVIGDIVQATGYRAPEVMLGLRLSEAIDMWGVGCVMAFLCFGRFLYLEQCEYEMMKFMVQVQGLPEDHMLRAGIYSLQYFSKVEGSSSPGWRLNSPEEYKEEAVKICQRSQEGLENEDAMAFLSLLKSCLHLDPSKRLTPNMAAQGSQGRVDNESSPNASWVSSGCSGSPTSTNIQ